MPTPTDCKLYNKTKKNVYKKYPKHSAYRSGILVKTYKKNFTKKYGTRKKPYSGEKTRKKGLSRWFKEEWKNQRGTVGYKYKSDVYRPTKRITKKTPTTFKELNKKQVKTARREKYRKGRVHRFKKGGKYPFPYNTDDKNVESHDTRQNIQDIEFNDEDVNMEVDEELSESEETFLNFLNLYKSLLTECFQKRALKIQDNNNIKTLKLRRKQLQAIYKNNNFEDFCEGLPNIDFLQDPELINNLDEHQLNSMLLNSEKLLNELLLSYINNTLDDRTEITWDNLERFIQSGYRNTSILPNVDEIKLVKIYSYCLIHAIISEMVESEFLDRFNNMNIENDEDL